MGTVMTLMAKAHQAITKPTRMLARVNVNPASDRNTRVTKLSSVGELPS
jgi:hypothetical protein